MLAIHFTTASERRRWEEAETGAEEVGGNERNKDAGLRIKEMGRMVMFKNGET